MFDPSSITPDQLNRLRHAAEQAWGDDTRHEAFIGHEQPSAGQCFVTSQWMTQHLGGHVGVKDGHHFWVSPDKRYVADLTGDQHPYPPSQPEHEGMLQDEDDEPWKYDDHHKQWRPGPVMYKSADHPLYKGFRVLDDHVNHPRAQLFARRANIALSGGRVSSVHVSDLMGPSGFETPQQAEDWNQNGLPMPMLHDEPQWDPKNDPHQEYKWVMSNGQLHVSPDHGHEELFEHAGGNPTSSGPNAVGYVTVTQGHALWEVESNMSLRGLHQVLQDYSNTVGWEFDGMVGSGGQPLHDDFGPKSSMWYTFRKDGHLIISKSPLPHGKRISIIGKTAYMQEQHPALSEWAIDFGYKLAEYPGGSDMTDKMKNPEHLDVFNRGDTDWQPERDNPDQDLGDSLTCGKCGLELPSLAELRLHHRDHEPQDSEEIQDGHFPQIDDFDAPMPFRRRQPSPMWGETIARMAVLPVRHSALYRHPRFHTYASIFGYETDTEHRFYGAYRQGQLVGYGAIRLNGDSEPEVLMIDALQQGHGIGTAILSLMQTHYDNFYTHADSDAGERLMRRQGMVNVNGHLWRWAKGQVPKDMIEAAIPFIYDAQKHWIEIGYPGQRTADIQGKFTPGGIVEGYYEPGGKMILIPSSNAPYTTHGIASVWYHRFPQMEITSIEREYPDGKTHKIAVQDVGNYIRAILPSDPAAHAAYQALRDAGGRVYVVGGAVRDALLQQDPKDIDLMVSGLPSEQVDHVLSQLPGMVKRTGKRFGVYRYRTGKNEVEVALPRQDEYQTGRRGEGAITVDHTLPVEKDLERRDFTANSMAVDLDSGQLIDPYGGAHDVDSHVLRTTHPDSFREDPTRLVRALVAHSRFGLNPDQRTREEMATNGHMLRHESPDALNKITDKLFASANPASAIRLGQDTGVLKHLFPEVSLGWDFDQNNPHHHYPLGQHSLNVLENIAKRSHDPDLRLAALYHDVGKPASEWRDPNTGYSHYYLGPNGEGANHEAVGAQLTEQRMRALNYPVARINRVRDLVGNHMFPAFNSPRGARKFLQRAGDHADDLLSLREADMSGKGQGPEELAARTSVDRMRELVDQSRRAQAPTDISNLAINGNDILSLGVQPGPQVGSILRALVDHVIEVPTDNNPARLLQLAKGYVNAQPT